MIRALFSPFNVIAALLLGGALLVNHLADQPPATPDAPKLQLAETRQVSTRIYFTDPTVQVLKAETRQVSVTQNNPQAVAQASLRAWVAGPSASGSLAVVPQGSSVPGVWVRGDHFYVDLPDSYTQLNIGSDSEHALICTITRTLLEQGGRDVTFLVSGKNADTLLGHEDLRTPLTRDDCAD